jgi:SAM-dependent methyltransferase
MMTFNAVGEEPSVCSICGFDDAITVFVGHDRQHGAPGRFPLNQCRRCGSFFLSPRPCREALPGYYPAGYGPYLAKPQARATWKSWLLSLGVRKQVNAITERVPHVGRALDVGCAAGTFLAALRQHGWEVQGVEFNPEVAAYARAHIPAEVFCGDLFDAGFPADTFDLITFWDVLEHLPDPRGALMEAARVARSRATLVVSLPDPDSLEARVFGRYWAGWDIPRHFYLWPHSALTRLLAECGWEPEGSICLRGRHWLLALSLRFWLQEQGVMVRRLGRYVPRFIESLPARVLLWPYFAAVERKGRGSIMVVFARKKE